MLTISLRSQTDTDAFCAFLRAVHVAVLKAEGTTVIATVPGAHSELHERRELTGYVVTWNALHPGRLAMTDV